MNGFLPLSTYLFVDRRKTFETSGVGQTLISRLGINWLGVLRAHKVLVVIISMAFAVVLLAAGTPALLRKGHAAIQPPFRSSNHFVTKKGLLGKGSLGEISISLSGANPLKTECGETFSDPGAVATTSAGKFVPVQVSGKVDTTTLGNYTLTYTASDDKDSASIERTVMVVDTTPPVISLKGGKTTTVNCGESFVEPGASALDSCQGSVPVTISGTIDSNVQGRYTITYTAVDASNNTRTVTREVIVGSVEDNPPTISLVGRPVMTIECGSGFSDPGVSATTPCSGPVPVVTSGTVDARTVGSYTITYAAANAELKSEAARSVTVIDTTAPVISINGDSPLTVTVRSVFKDPGAIARDGCAGDFPAAAVSTVDSNTIGSYTVTYTASDPSGNQAAPVKRTVNVVEAPLMPAEPFPLVDKLLGLNSYAAERDFTAGSIFGLSCFTISCLGNSR
jgi:hypothetical protein